MSDDLVNRLLGTPLYEGHGDPSDIPEQAANEITTLRERLEQAERERDSAEKTVLMTDYMAGFLAGIEAAAERVEKLGFTAQFIRDLSPSDNTTTVAEAAKVLVENFGGVVHREFNKSGWGSQAAKEALRALAEQKEGD